MSRTMAAARDKNENNSVHILKFLLSLEKTEREKIITIQCGLRL